jgi:hypothetical protein
MELSEKALNKYLADGGNDKVVEAYEELTKYSETERTVRVEFVDGSVSDWKITLDEDGTVLDGFCYNDVI